eukprot:3941362-Rhodomonas_salina.1
MCGTELAYGAMGSPLLSQRIVLRLRHAMHGSRGAKMALKVREDNVHALCPRIIPCPSTILEPYGP